MPNYCQFWHVLIVDVSEYGTTHPLLNQRDLDGWLANETVMYVDDRVADA